MHGFPKSDPAYAVLAGLLEVVPTTSWMFARVEPNGELSMPDELESSPADLEVVVDEYRRHRAVSAAGPRIAATLRRFGHVSGITLIFADARADYGLIILLRDATLPPYSSIEISILTFALDAGSDRLAALRLQPPDEQKPAFATRIVATPPTPYDEAFYVLDRDFEIVLAWSSERQRRIASTGIHEHIAERLPTILEESVRELTASWASSTMPEPGFARPVSFLVVRTQPMSGPAGLFIGVRIDRFRPPNSLTGAASRFHISPREAQVLALLLDGDHLDQIADQLKITSSTVQDHIKSMLDKTESRNRSELIARILGWESSPNPRAML
jgi:DNA-binding CsgD family transcriptional regulator